MHRVLGYVLGSDFLPRGACLDWRPGMLWLYGLSDCFAGLAFAFLSVLLFHVVRKRKDLPSTWVFVAIGIFLLACAASRAMSILTLWIPVYRLDSLVRAITAIAAVTTAYCLTRFRPLLLTIAAPPKLEDQFAVLANAIPNLAWMANADGYLYWYNRRWYEYTNTTPEQMEGWGWKSVHDQERLPAVMERWQTSIRTGKPFEMELRLRSGAGTFSWFLTRVSPLRNATGEVVRWIGTNTDVTGIHEAQEALRESESHFRQIADALPQMVWMADRDGAVQWLNGRWYDYTGSTPERSEGHGWAHVLNPDCRHNPIQDWERSVQTGDLYQTECSLRRSDGAYRWFLGRGNPVRGADGSIVKWFGTFTDIEDYKQAEAEIISLNASLEQRVYDRTEQLARANASLRETRARLEAILDAATGVSIIAVDVDGRIQIFNKGAEIMLQYRAEELVGLYTPEVVHLASEIEEESRRLSADVGYPVLGMEVFTRPARCARGNDKEWTYIRKDGSTLSVCLVVTAVRNSENQINGYLGIATDISARKKLEAELRENNDKLKRESERVIEANLAKSAFLATMSHEIRTPLNAILGMSDLLAESPLDSDQRQYVDVFRRAGNTLLCLINDILDLAKIESGHFALENLEFDLDDVIARSLELVKPRASIKGLTLLSNVEMETQTKLVGDPGRLQQVLVNLLGNAVKFTERGEINLAVRPLREVDPGRLEFSVTDTGIGIPIDKQKAIFEDFAQASGETTRNYGGTGLGLGICRRLVALMHGQITLESAPGLGSSFRFTASFVVDGAEAITAQSLPARETERPRAQILHQPEASSLASARPMSILVAEDSPDNRALLRAYLKASPHELTFTENGQAAVDEFSDREFDVVLMDMQMPVMDGLIATRRIREIESHRQLSGGSRKRTPVIALTASARDADVEASWEAGCDAHLSKPISKGQLLGSLAAFAPPELSTGSPEGLIWIHQPSAAENTASDYLQSRKRDLAELVKMMVASEFTGIQRLAQGLNGSGDPFGLTDLNRIAKSLEDSAKAESLPGIGQQLTLLASYLGRVQVRKA